MENKPADKPETKKITVRINRHVYDALRKLHGDQKIESITDAVNIALVKFLLSFKKD